ncbi:A-kinase anchor protein 10, mitochondrial [Nilaparvata lugens]|uniref:A-kinase anchor protein 10, mitochondrial n=1 Tax=Nilaparvata lugens TaxID=108931 RepID=UPI00193DAECE|nr:A-kinase anchor protein 10, mitochondrial [Nilaparvata lugens]
MLPFWKKTLQKNKSPLSSPGKKVNGSVESPVEASKFFEPCSRGPLFDFKYDNEDVLQQKSRLLPTFRDALDDRLAQSFFMQYLEARGYASLLNALHDLKKLLRPAQRSAVSHEAATAVSGSATAVGRGAITRTRSNDAVSLVSEGNLAGSARVRCVSESGDQPANSANRIWQRYLAEDAQEHIRVPEELRSCVHASRSHPDAQEHALHRLHDHVQTTLEKDLWNEYVSSEWHVKYQVEVLTSRNINLADILHHNTALTSFIEFLEQEGCQYIIEFWLAATNFESLSQCDDIDPLQAQNDAMIIYDKYLSLQALCPLGVADSVRCDVEQNICREESLRPAPACFRPALRLALGYLQTVWLPAFVCSQHYVVLLAELLRSSGGVGNSGAGGSSAHAHNASPSPASSVTDLSGCGEGAAMLRRDRDPDSIWKRRRQACGLSIGRIDQLGRFETDMELGSDRKSESRISRVVKKLVNKDEGKAQEDMAWRIAEMIVKDVTDITMGGGAGLSDDDDYDVT